MKSDNEIMIESGFLFIPTFGVQRDSWWEKSLQQDIGEANGRSEKRRFT